MKPGGCCHWGTVFQFLVNTHIHCNYISMQIQLIITPDLAVKPTYAGCWLEQTVDYNPCIQLYCPVKYLPMTTWYLLTPTPPNGSKLEKTFSRPEDLQYVCILDDDKAPALMIKLLCVSVCVCVCLCVTDWGDARGKPRRLEPRHRDQWDRGESVQQAQVRIKHMKTWWCHSVCQ